MSSHQVIVKMWSEFTPDDVFDMAVLRSEVYFLEQKIDEEEFDASDRDPSTIHLWIEDDHGMAAYMRIVHQPGAASAHHGIADSFGRMVVRKDRRGEGLAQLLLSRAIELAGDTALYLHSQEYVTPLYAKFGFVVQGEVFEEAGIPHRLMVRAAGA